MDRSVYAMGTTLHLVMEGPQANSGSEAAINEVARIERACSTWRSDSDWSRLNAAQGKAVKLEPEWIQLLLRSTEWSHRTEGAFDPVLMALLQTWGTRTGGRTPSPVELMDAKRASGYWLLALSENEGSARLLQPQAGVEEGAFLKGYALDMAMQKAKAIGVAKGCMNFGGQVLAWGEETPVSIADPKQRHVSRLTIRLQDASLSTSGCSERGRHILDPRTGIPCEAWGSASVVSASAYEADVLSTALYVMGPRKGLAWASNHHIAALFLLSGHRVRMSPAFRMFHPSIFLQGTK